MNNDVGIYVHIPFCLGKCAYCDFVSSAQPIGIQNAYVDALCEEISSYNIENRAVTSIFIGGGTPSVLPVDALARVTDALRARFSITPDAEITIEANPATVTPEKADAYRAIGINRVSIGVQSFHDEELRALGRLHTAKEAKETVSILRAAGFTAINLDLMYGIPNQTLASFGETLDEALALDVGHISAYSLILEEGSALYLQKDRLVLPSPDEERAMYDLVVRRLTDRAYRHYEISNYAKDGCECRHNLRYWQRGDYLSFGLAAHSCLGALRLAHTDNLKEYLDGDRTPRVIESLSEGEIDAERVMLGLRTDRGIDRETLFRVVSADKHAFIERCRAEGYLEYRDDRAVLTDRGMYVSNAVFCEILPVL